MLGRAATDCGLDSPLPELAALKEQVLWIERFDTHEQLRSTVRGFARRYNEHWLLERHGYRTPIETRQHLLHQAALA